jgi:hypothetical protein
MLERMRRAKAVAPNTEVAVAAGPLRSTRSERGKHRPDPRGEGFCRHRSIIFYLPFHRNRILEKTTSTRIRCWSYESE